MPNSFTKEWAGLIGQNYLEFNRAPYIILASLFAYFFIIIIINMIKKDLETSMEMNHISFQLKKKKKFRPSRQQKKVPMAAHDFSLQRNQQ